MIKISLKCTIFCVYEREKKELDIENQDEKEDTPKFGRMMFMDVRNKIERTNKHTYKQINKQLSNQTTFRK